MLRFILISNFLVISLLTKTFAASTFPRGCEVTGYGFNQNLLVLNETGNQTLYLIQNRSDAQIELERQDSKDTFMSPQLQSKLDPNNWAAFASDEANFQFRCFVHQNNNTAIVNCNDVLEVCQYPRVKFALANMGNYWVSTNKPQSQVIKDATDKGIYLKW
ncbi:Enhanced entry protein EnhB (plasmid) [Legionella adelaidensis]|uniref:Enhanced entry protein EnhB n=1 Tax=Legionella adelaidensis TaxID=45056 RepID=A0A0W0R1Y7_9GAMM|nr:hypothetical protein [Legionella adelaidensis]KTC65092.1 enhanced entry protein EnhB [Legionella adelaidensis]VEH85388.1 Enhanced entry protein EnhB [Legionella adelaidensis]